MESTKSQIFAFIRHGERADEMYNGLNLILPREDTNEEFDPPLSKLGVEQASETGRFL